MLSEPEHRNSSLAWPALLVKNVAEERVEPLCQDPSALGVSRFSFFFYFESVIRDLSLFYQFLNCEWRLLFYFGIVIWQLLMVFYLKMVIDFLFGDSS